MMPWSEEGKKAGEGGRRRGGGRSAEAGVRRELPEASRPLPAAPARVARTLGHVVRRTLFEKVWDAHVVSQVPGRAGAALRGPAPGARGHLAPGIRGPAAGGPARPPARAHRGHGGPQRAHRRPSAPDRRPDFGHGRWRRWCETPASSGSELFNLDSPEQGIVHVIGPELGLTQPGMTIVCGDSHTSTHGAFGALAFGIGTSEVEHVLATQCVVQTRPAPWRFGSPDCRSPGSRPRI